MEHITESLGGSPKHVGKATFMQGPHYTSAGGLRDVQELTIPNFDRIGSLDFTYRGSEPSVSSTKEVEMVDQNKYMLELLKPQPGKKPT